MSGQRRPATPERFVQVWQTSSSVQQAARRLRMTEKSVRVRASKYRTRGVRLKLFHGWLGSERLDVRELNRVISRLGDHD